MAGEILYIARGKSNRYYPKGLLTASPYCLKRNDSIRGWCPDTDGFNDDMFLTLPIDWFPNLTNETSPMCISLNFITIPGDGKHKEE